MTDNHPIIPSPELVQQWRDSPEYTDGKRKLVMVTLSTGKLQDIATKASQWGADQELNECCKWLPKLPPWSADDLRKHRRPKPPSLKEQALAVIENSEICDHLSPEHATILRRALEALDD